MPHIAQHEAAELWELCRDHAIAASKLRVMATMCQDPQVRSTVQRHAQAFQSAAQRLFQLLQEPGQAGYAGTWQAAPGATWQAGPGQAVGQVGTVTPQAYAPSYGAATGAAAAPYDTLVAGDCLRMCKTFAVQCIWGATEASQPARDYLYQLAGEHLRMADEHYRWLEQHGTYASPRATYEAIAEYASKLQQIISAGQAVTPYAQQPGYGGSVTSPYGYAAGHGGQGGAYGSAQAYPATGQPPAYAAGQAGGYGGTQVHSYYQGYAGETEAGRYGEYQARRDDGEAY